MKGTDLIACRRRVDDLVAERRQAVALADGERRSLSAVESEIEAVARAQRVVQQIAQVLQQRVHRRIAAVVTRALAAVFDDPYQFAVRFDRKRGRTEARLVFVRDGLELDEPLDSVGGGVVDVAALALRLACVVLARPPRRRLLVLDEPFRFVRGRENRARTRRMLTGLAGDLGFQIILCTDIPEYRLGMIVEMGERDGT